jgi:mRNA interferase RelE/StbE
MRFALETTARFDRQFKKRSPAVQSSIISYLKKNVDGTTDPRSCGKGLSGKLSGMWRYRVGDYRIICVIEDDRLIVLALEVGHRRMIYKKT